MTDEIRISSPFISVHEEDPSRAASPLRILVLSDLQAVSQRIAHLSQWLAENGFAFSIDLVLVIGVSREHKRTDVRHIDLAELGNDSVTLAELENICPRVAYVPGLHEAGAIWEANNTLSLTPTSLNAIKGPVEITSDLLVVHRRYADGLTDKPVWQLPPSWRNTLYSKMSPPRRYRKPRNKSAIVLCSSQLPNEGSSSKSLAFLRTVRSLITLKRHTIPNLDYILAVVPSKMQRVPSPSKILDAVDQTLDPRSFADGDFWIVDLRRPALWDPTAQPDVDEDNLASENAWQVEKMSMYNLELPASETKQGS